MEDILKSILTKLDDNFLQAISQKTNASPDKAKSAMAAAIPILMNALGSVINSYLKTEKKQAPKSQSIINQLLDQNNDGSIIDDIARMGMSFLKRRK